MQEQRYRKNTKVKIIQGGITSQKYYDNIQEKLENFISTHDVIEIKQSVCQSTERFGILIYTVFYNEYDD